MTFDPVTLEVDGTLRNPIVLRGVVIWAIALLVVFGLIIRGSRGPWPLAFATVVALAITPGAQMSIASMFYARDGFLGVGFWGRPPFWLAPLAALMVVLLARSVYRWRRAHAA